MVEEPECVTGHAIRHYEVIAIEVPIVFNSEGDHDHNGMLFALERNKAHLEAIRSNTDSPDPLVRPLVLRARCGETLKIRFTNHVKERCVGIHLVGDGYDVQTSDGAAVGGNAPTLAAPGHTEEYQWKCDHEGVFPFHDAGNLSGGEEGTNVHGLFGALVVEPEDAAWSDPVSGDRLDEPDELGQRGDGLYVDVHPSGWRPFADDQKTPLRSAPREYPLQPEGMEAAPSFREYVVFFHDEPEFRPPHVELEPNPCPETTTSHFSRGSAGGDCDDSGRGDRYGCRPCHDGLDGHATHIFGEHRRRGGSEHEGPLPIMPISYRAEPMVNRERKLWRMIREGQLQKPVIGEEQHHSSWLFGDPATPILRAYVGDPIRVRLVHAAVKETHVFHQHVYQWHADPGNKNSLIIDSVSISPQTAHTIDFLWGAGSQQGAIGDAIFHCHLYPHFHEGMWGITRTFDRLQDGTQPYPDHTRDKPHLIERLQPLPDRQALPRPTAAEPGFPNFIPGTPGQKSPIPPWPFTRKDDPKLEWTSDLDYRPPELMTQQERNHLNSAPQPGALFNVRPFPPHLEGKNVVERDMAVILTPIVYNDSGWYDPIGHAFVLADDATAEQRGNVEPLVVRGHAGTVVQTTLENRLPTTIHGTRFDLPFPPCDFFPTPLAECGLHVHLVKFDPLVSDGASVGWNYMSGPRAGKKMIYRWYVDEEFGTVFFHDHLFANYRQKHGLFGAFIAEPPGARFLDPHTHLPIRSGLEAVIAPEEGCDHFPAFREFCFAVADFIPLFNGRGRALNPPTQRGGHGDQGVMAVNYRSEPIVERNGDPAFWFLSRRHEYEVSDRRYRMPRRQSRVHHGDPATGVFEAHAGDPVRIRMFQGSHEEQHSFQIHGLRWRQFIADASSPLRNQQTIGISEAFSFEIDRRYGPGDHLWKLAAADDLWLGCWGLIRVHPRGTTSLPSLPSIDEALAATAAELPTYPDPAQASDWRRFRVVAEPRTLIYREHDLIDPFGLVYRLEAYANPGSDEWITIPCPVTPSDPPQQNKDGVPIAADIVEPLILRCRRGEGVQIELRNALPLGMKPEPFAPEVPVERRDRPVSSRVSIHADLLRYDIRMSDGANVGNNPLQTVEPGESKTYYWYADQDLGPVLLQDMADFRNHRHHGLVGALVVEPDGATPRVPGPKAGKEAWHGSRATIHLPNGSPKEETVLILQDGLRLFFHGNISFPIPDEPDLQDDPGGDRPDVEDQGQKGFNYRSEPVGPPRWLQLKNPATPIFEVPADAEVFFRLIVGADKPRNHSFTVHGHTWVASHMSEAGRRVGAVSALTCGWAGTLELRPPYLENDRAAQQKHSDHDDYAYRTGVLKWTLLQGLWGILRRKRLPITASPEKMQDVPDAGT